MDALVLIGAGCVAIIVFIIASNAFSSHSLFSGGAAQVMAGIVGFLVVLSFLDTGKSLMSGLLLPYAALGVACVVLVLFLFLARCLRGTGWKKGTKLADLVRRSPEHEFQSDNRQARGIQPESKE
ncbi:MAG: hypothetical protein WC299_05635 [Kiritimatiellia bacterium]